MLHIQKESTTYKEQTINQKKGFASYSNPGYTNYLMQQLYKSSHNENECATSKGGEWRKRKGYFVFPHAAKYLNERVNKHVSYLNI